MFDVGWSELLLIGIVALIAIGPKELPGALRSLGQWMTKIRRMASEFQNQFHEAMREAELADLKKEVDDMAAKAQSYAHFDPIDDIRKDLEKAAGPLPDLEGPLSSPSGTTASLSDPSSSVAEPEAAAPTSAEAAPVVTHAVSDPPAPAPIAAAEPAPSAGKPDAGRAA